VQRAGERRAKWKMQTRSARISSAVEKLPLILFSMKLMTGKNTETNSEPSPPKNQPEK
jgi:hypothetical protein